MNLVLLNRVVLGRRWQALLWPKGWRRARGPWPKRHWSSPIFYRWILGPVEVRRFEE